MKTTTKSNLKTGARSKKLAVKKPVRGKLGKRVNKIGTTTKPGIGRE